MTSKLLRALPSIFLILSLLGAYSSTLAPGLTWANYGADGGDLITAAATGGVAHPSGYPLYLLLAQGFQLLPLGSLAFRTNLLSMLAMILAAWLVYSLAADSFRLTGGRFNRLAGLAAALSFGLAPLAWSQAVITEVYALHILFVTVILALSSGWMGARLSPHRFDLAFGMVFGLSLGNHVTTILLLPLLFSALPGERRWFPALRRLAWMLGWAVLVYLTLAARAWMNPPVNWNDPTTPGGLLSLVSGELYQGKLLSLAPALLWERLRSVAGLLLDQAGIAGLLFASLGSIVFFKPSRLQRNVLWVAAANLAFALVYGTADSFVYLLPVCLAFSIWVGGGLAGVMRVLSPQLPRLGLGLGWALLLFLLLLGWGHRSSVDASQDMRAENFGRDVLSRAPQNAIIYTSGDRSLFTLWYFHFALGERPDLAVVSTELLGFDWYQETLSDTYPSLQLPGPLPFAERMTALNPGRSACYVEYDGGTRIECFPPLPQQPE